MVDEKFLSQMKSSAILVNASRGGLVHEADLANALDRGTIRAALLDVVDGEPIRIDNPLLHAPNCLLTPHNAWASIRARKTLMDGTANNIRKFQLGTPINVVNEAVP